MPHAAESWSGTYRTPDTSRKPYDTGKLSTLRTLTAVRRTHEDSSGIPGPYIVVIGDTRDRCPWRTPAETGAVDDDARPQLHGDTAALSTGRSRDSIVVLVFVSVLAGITESAILTALAQAAAALAAGLKRVHVAIGPLHVNASIGTLIGTAFSVAVIRLVLIAPMTFSGSDRRTRPGRVRRPVHGLY